MDRILTVITFTVDRIDGLSRCIESVQNQFNVKEICHRIYSENAKKPDATHWSGRNRV